jgi:hypothetical protein
VIHFYILTGLIDGAGGATVDPPEVIPTRAGGGGGPAFRPKSKRHASPYKDTQETAGELQTRVTLDVEESETVEAVPEAPKPSPKRPDRLREVLADTEAAAAAQGIMADALRGVEAQLRAAIEAKEMDEDEAVALILILAEV